VCPDFPGTSLADTRFAEHKTALHSLAARIRADRDYPEVAESLGGISVHFDFGQSPRPWQLRQGGETRGVGIEIVLPFDCAARCDPEQVHSLFARSLALVLSESYPELPALSALDVPPVAVDLVYLSGMPHCGGLSPKWAKNSDVDAFAKAARLVGDLARPSLLAGGFRGPWPMMELLPDRSGGAGPELIHDGRSCVVDLPRGFSSRPAGERAEYTLSAYLVALGLLASSMGEDWSAALEALEAAVRRTGFRYDWRSKTLITGETRSWAEYAADPDGGRLRMAVRDGTDELRSPWLPYGLGAQDAITITPIQDLEWRRDTLRMRLQEFDRWANWTPGE
jgi:hypothetical protein